MLATRTASTTELRDNLASLLDSLEQSGSVMILRHSKPAAYLVLPALFEALLEKLEDAEDMLD
ncbi:MAG: type II toxin-antitoxin system Phd/YefM family antitoxin, partial [Chloroflexi bacterium]|nr:type II toxin-antitoxin system Phd/YefM family antitoxin [Chloroflexota bacterium]